MCIVADPIGLEFASSGLSPSTLPAAVRNAMTPQAAALIEEVFTAEVVMADTAYDAIVQRQSLAGERHDDGFAVIPTNRGLRSAGPLANIRSTERASSMAKVISLMRSFWQSPSEPLQALSSSRFEQIASVVVAAAVTNSSHSAAIHPNGYDCTIKCPGLNT